MRSAYRAHVCKACVFLTTPNGPLSRDRLGLLLSPAFWGNTLRCRAARGLDGHLRGAVFYYKSDGGYRPVTLTYDRHLAEGA